MSAPELNQLLQEAVRLTEDLAQHAETAATAATATAERATALGALAAQEADSLHQEMAQAVDALAHAREQVDHAASAAVDVLHSLPARAEEAESQIKALLAAVRDEVEKVDAARQHLLQATDGSARQLDAAFQELQARIQSLEQRAQGSMQQAHQHLESLQSAVTAAQEQVNAEGRKLNDSFRGLAALAQQSVQAMDVALSHALGDVATHVVELCNDAIQGHNGLVFAIRHGFTGETPASAPPDTWLATALDPLHNALTDLVQLPETVRDAVHGPIATLLDNGEKAISALGGIADSLQRAMPKES